MRHRASIPASDAPMPLEKVDFLSRPEAYGGGAENVTRLETHMSWVFLVGDKAFKLKKPVRFPYLDFSTKARREAACRSELCLNRRLAEDVYRDVVPLTRTVEGLAIGGSGVPVDWLVVMRRLDDSETMERMILEGRLCTRHLDHLVEALGTFYRHAGPARVTPAVHLADWRRNLRRNYQVLTDPDLALPQGLVRRIDSAQRRFLATSAGLLAARVRSRHVVDGHGDLRPEHIFIGDRIRVIDCLEFNPRLRAIDPLDEIAFLSIECDRLGAAWVGAYLERRTLRAFGKGVPLSLFHFYRCYRATLRARLAIAHLLEPGPRLPEKWPGLARAYLRLAAEDAHMIEKTLGAGWARSVLCPESADLLPSA